MFYMYVLHEPKDYSFDKVGIKGKIFGASKVSDVIEFVVVDTEAGHETTIVEHDSTFCYYILAGSGYFEIDGTKEQCQTGDLVVIPPGHEFTYKGTFKLLLVDTPPWREGQEETITE
jgi:mannose-6-phosphate isomerase-like protein (cupin superfamily)